MSSTDRRWLIAGRVAKPHGVHGNVLVRILGDFPERLEAGVEFGLGPESGPDAFHTAHSVRIHRGRWLLAVEGIRSRDVIEAWRDLYLFLPEQTMDERPEGFVYRHELIGLAVVSPDGERLGTVVELDTGSAQRRLVVERGSGEHLVPYVPEIVLDVDLEAGTVTVDAPPGLLDDDAF